MLINFSPFISPLSISVLESTINIFFFQIINIRKNFFFSFSVITNSSRGSISTGFVCSFAEFYRFSFQYLFCFRVPKHKFAKESKLLPFFSALFPTAMLLKQIVIPYCRRRPKSASTVNPVIFFFENSL